MTKIVDISEAQHHLRGLLALARRGDQIIIEETGESPVRLVSIADEPRKLPKLGLREGKVWTSDDFDVELPDSFWLGEGE
jgi:antitoxin (DNA-binding transcriptional repressor) of toxin-antitoxin stability system